MTAHTKRILLAAFAALVFSSVATAQFLAQHTESTTSDRFSDVENDHGWGLPSRNQSQLTTDVLAWTAQHFSNKVVVGQAGSGDPVLPMEFFKAVTFEVIQPSLLRRAQAMEITIPSTHSVFILRDAKGDLYNAVVEQYGARFYIREIGPALDYTLASASRSLSERRLTSWPPDRAQKGKLVFVPYPTPANQIFVQLGSDPTTATFQDLHTGGISVGLNSILDRNRF